MKRFIVCLLFIAIVLRVLDNYLDKNRHEKYKKIQQEITQADEFNTLVDRFNSSAIVPEEIKESSLKKAYLLLQEGDALVDKARQFKAVLNVLPPVAMELLEKAVSNYQKTKDITDKLLPDTDPEYNYLLSFLKGSINFRYLQVFADQQTAMEYYNQTLINYRNALKYKPRDTNTIVNIELLLKNFEKSAGMGSNKDAPIQQRLLNQVGSSNVRGN